ncbi:stress-induced receptor-like kinase, partial [Trifolium medium]|nr:stress-induced receptor-like kinase [Trifolium medium]
MNIVIEMLEGDIENIEMPPKPSLYPTEMIREEFEVISIEIESKTDATPEATKT